MPNYLNSTTAIHLVAYGVAGMLWTDVTLSSNLPANHSFVLGSPYFCCDGPPIILAYSSWKIAVIVACSAGGVILITLAVLWWLLRQRRMRQARLQHVADEGAKLDIELAAAAEQALERGAFERNAHPSLGAQNLMRNNSWMDVVKVRKDLRCS